MSFTAMAASWVGMLVTRLTRLLATGSGCWTSMTCEAAPATGVVLTWVWMAPPPEQMVPATHAVQVTRPLTSWLEKPGLHVHWDWTDAPAIEELCTGHRLAMPLEHQEPAGQAAHVGPAYPGLHIQLHAADEAKYDACAGAPLHVLHTRSVVGVQAVFCVWPIGHTVHRVQAETLVCLVRVENVSVGHEILPTELVGQYPPGGHTVAVLQGVGQ